MRIEHVNGNKWKFWGVLDIFWVDSYFVYMENEEDEIDVSHQWCYKSIQNIALYKWNTNIYI